MAMPMLLDVCCIRLTCMQNASLTGGSGFTLSAVARSLDATVTRSFAGLIKTCGGCFTWIFAILLLLLLRRAGRLIWTFPVLRAAASWPCGKGGGWLRLRCERSQKLSLPHLQQSGDHLLLYHCLMHCTLKAVSACPAMDSISGNWAAHP
jgi:hypothetical protein